MVGYAEDLADGTVRYWVIDGLEVCDSTTRYGIDLRVTQYITVRNCAVHDNQVTGIFDAFSDDNVYEFNQSYNNHEHGFYHSNSGDRVTLRGNRSHHNDGCGLHMNGDASMGGDGVIAHAVVERNVIYENGAVRGGSGINGDGVWDSIIRNNLLYNNHASGLSLYAIDAAEGSSRNLVYNNTIVVPSDGRWAVNIPAADGGQASPTGNSILNNVLYNNHSWHGVITVYGPAALAGSDYNVVMDCFGYPDDSTVIDLAAWQAL